MIKKILLLVVPIMIVLVLGNLVIFFSINNNNNKVKINEEILIENQQFTSIEIDVDSTDVEFITVSNPEDAKVELVGKSNENVINDLTINKDGETLSISFHPKINKMFNINFRDPALKLKVFIPEKVYENVTVDGASSDIDGQSLEVNLLNISIHSGEITLNEIISEDVTLNTHSGDVEIENVEGEIKTETHSGDIFITNSEILHPINAKTHSGEILIKSKKEPADVTYKVNTNSGDVDLFDKYHNNVEIGNGKILIQLETGSGDITAEIK